MSTGKQLVLMDVDTQHDFVSPDGAFGPMIVEWGVGRIVPNLARLFAYAADRRLTTILPTDAHVPHDPEFVDGMPWHCVVGTPGHERIAETDLTPTLVIENRPDAFTAPLPMADRLVVKVHKQHFAVGTNPNFAALMAAIGPCHVMATGVATQGCVKASIQSLLDLGITASIVVDAVGPDIFTDEGRIAIEELQALGVNAVTTAEVCDGALESLLAAA
jgi:nicotinamidase-related amidase